jgi:hypothetical protein
MPSAVRREIRIFLYLSLSIRQRGPTSEAVLRYQLWFFLTGYLLHALLASTLDKFPNMLCVHPPLMLMAIRQAGQIDTLSRPREAP